jgi:hypothetical protein
MSGAIFLIPPMPSWHGQGKLYVAHISNTSSCVDPLTVLLQRSAEDTPGGRQSCRERVRLLNCSFVSHWPLTEVHLTESWKCRSFVFDYGADHAKDDPGIDTRRTPDS